MKLKYFLTGFLLVLATASGFAQVSFNKRAMGTIGSAPNAGNFANGASLDQVDKATGTLRIGIPLYEIKVNDISVPITLNYSATGIKVGQEAGIAGMGWELSAGGKIITNIQGKRDDAAYGMTTNLIPEPFDFFTNSAHKTILRDIIDGKRDYAWDTYSYSLPHGSGSFTANGLTFPYDPMVKIDYTNKKISTADGLVYAFSQGDIRKTTRMINYPANASPVYSYDLVDNDPTTWSDYDLKSITSTRFKDVVNFEYQIYNTPGDIAKLSAKKTTNVSESLPLYRNVETSSPYGGVSNPESSHLAYDVLEPVVSTSVTEYTSHSRISAIDYPGGRVEFEYNATDVLGRDVLNNIRIIKKENGVLDTLTRYEFIYDPDKTYGHYLSYIKRYDAGNVYRDIWTFGYFGNHLPVVPNSGSRAQDRWGFYNGATENKTLLENPDNCRALRLFPHYPVMNTTQLQYSRKEAVDYYGTGTAVAGSPGKYRIQFANRDVGTLYCQDGTLNRIVTPLGASYNYYYEPHRYQYTSNVYSPGGNFSVPVAEPGGGIRITSIFKNRNSGEAYNHVSDWEETMSKAFSYGEGTMTDNTKDANGVGNANIPATIIGNVSVYANTSYNKDTQPDLYYTFIKNLMMLSHPINDLVQTGGSYVMYKSVTETEYDLNANNGETVYYNILPQIDPYMSNGYIGPYPGGANSNLYLSGEFDGRLPYTPYFSVNAGISVENGATLGGIKKYAWNNGAYQLKESRSYDYKFFDNPDKSGFHLRNFYASLAGQLSGPLPVNPSMPEATNPPVPDGRGGSVMNYMSTHPSGEGGTIDFIAATFYMNQDYTPDFPSKYAVKGIDLENFSYNMKMVKEDVKIYGKDLNSDPASEVITEYAYDNKTHMQPTLITKSTVTGNPAFTTPESSITRLYYEPDFKTQFMYPGAMTESMTKMEDTKMAFNEPIFEYTGYKTGSPAVEKMTGGTINTFKVADGAVVPDKVYKITVPANFNMASMPVMDAWGYFGTPADTAFYKEQISYDIYKNGQVHQYTELAQRGNVILYGYNNQYPIAKVTNADKTLMTTIGAQYYANRDVAYTSFETADECNWSYTGVPVADANTPSGKKVYNLATGAIIKRNETLNHKFIISYWFKTGADVHIDGCTATTAVVKNTWGQWSYAEHEISNPSASNPVKISGTGYIDELRFYPADAQMTTYLYTPMIGLSCSFDANGKPTWYEYDQSQRLKQVRDHNGNIVKAYKYQTEIQ